MKLALFSDIHANLPALEAFFKQLESVQPDGVYCLGDVVGYCVWPNEVINVIRKKHIPTLAGNHDAVVGLPTNSPSGVFTNSVIGASEKAYVLSLPAHIRLEFQLPGQCMQFLFVHGSPRRNNEYLTEETDAELLLEIMDEAGADVLCFGHTHKPFHRILPTEKGCKHAINLGSLGKPKDGDSRGCYAVLEWDADFSLQDPKGFKVDFQRVAYDLEKATSAIEASSLPNTFAQALRAAK
jgi:putative phosphoesterase